MSAKIMNLQLVRDEKIQEEIITQEEFKKTVTKSIRALFAGYEDMEFMVFEMNKKIERLQEQALHDK